MKREIIQPENEKAWLGLREDCVSSTMSPALFGLSPYLTEYELYYSKASKLPLPFEPNERVFVGSRMQDFAADEVALKNGWTVWRADEFVVVPEIKMGSSFDFRVRCPERGEGILEIKAVDWKRHRDLWVDEQAPEHIEIQLQHQLEVYDKFDWGVIVAFTGLYDHHCYFRQRDREMGAAIIKRIQKFWTDVAAGTPPSPDYSRDSDVIKALHRDDAGVLDRTEDLEFNALLARMARLQDEKKQIEDDYKATQAELIHRLGNCGEAFGRDYKFKVTMTKDSPGTEVTADMVGTCIGARKGYPRCTLSDMHKKRNAA
jgi:predicted phage-related endonuclease